MVLFCFQPTYSDRRVIMRNTWLSQSFLQQHTGLSTKILFFIGLADNTRDQMRIEYENEVYRDIVQSDFIDSYINNTYKAMSFLQ